MQSKIIFLVGCVSLVVSTQAMEGGGSWFKSGKVDFISSVCCIGNQQQLWQSCG